MREVASVQINCTDAVRGSGESAFRLRAGTGSGVGDILVGVVVVTLDVARLQPAFQRRDADS